MRIETVGSITKVETIATGSGIRILRYLRKHYGAGRWRKLKGKATVRLPNGAVRRVVGQFESVIGRNEAESDGTGSLDLGGWRERMVGIYYTPQ